MENQYEVYYIEGEMPASQAPEFLQAGEKKTRGAGYHPTRVFAEEKRLEIIATGTNPRDVWITEGALDSEDGKSMQVFYVWTKEQMSEQKAKELRQRGFTVE